MVGVIPLVDEFVEDLWYDEPANGADPPAEAPEEPHVPDPAPGHRIR